MNLKENYSIKNISQKETNNLLSFNYRTSMQTDLNVYKSTVEQQSNVNAQLRSLQDKITRDKNEFEEV